VLNEIRGLKAKSISILESVLDEIPATLEGYYERVFERICQQPRSDQKVANFLVMWLTYTAQPLTLDMLATAFTIDWRLQKQDQSRRLFDPEQMVYTCGNLISIKRGSMNSQDTASILSPENPPNLEGSLSSQTSLQFVHWSVQSYIRDNGKDEGNRCSNPALRAIIPSTSESYHEILGTCLTYQSLWTATVSLCPGGSVNSVETPQLSKRTSGKGWNHIVKF